MGARHASHIGGKVVVGMRRILQRKQFLRDLKRLKSRGKNPEEIFSLVRVLGRDGRLPINFRPHKLHGEYHGLWECRVEQNWVLIYDISDTEIILAHTGTHEDLFG